MALSIDHENLLRTMFWSHDILNAVVVGMDDDHKDLSRITYNPFKNETIRLPANAYTRDELFADKISDIFGYPIKIIMYRDTMTSFRRSTGKKPINFNYDGFLPDVISSAMNATLLLKTPFTKDFDVEDVKDADLIINGRSFPLNVLHEVGMEETISLRRDDICVFLPYDRLHETFRGLSKTVSHLVSMLMVVVLFQTWITLYLMRLVHRYNTWNQVPLLDFFGIQMNQSLPRIPGQIAPRLIIACWLIYCLIINSVFLGSLYKSMSDHSDYKITTIDELLNTNQYELLVSTIFYNYSESFLNNSPIKNRFNVIDFTEYLNRVESNEVSYAYVARYRGAKYFENILLNDGLPVYYTMEQCVVPLMTYYFTGRGCPFVNKINGILRLAEENGMFRYWEEQLINAYNQLKQSQRLFIHHDTADHLEHLVFVFEIWMYGLVLSTVTFIIEWFAIKFSVRIEKWFKVKLLKRA